jgi:hypothetical protein
MRVPQDSKALVGTFVTDLTDLLIADSMPVREVAREALGSELSPRLYSRLVKHLDEYVHSSTFVITCRYPPLESFSAFQSKQLARTSQRHLLSSWIKWVLRCALYQKLTSNKKSSLRFLNYFWKTLKIPRKRPSVWTLGLHHLLLLDSSIASMTLRLIASRSSFARSVTVCAPEQTPCLFGRTLLIVTVSLTS